MTLEFVEIQGLVFSPDLPPPSGTVRLYRVVSGPNSHEQPEKVDVTTAVGPATEGDSFGGYRYGDGRSLEGYIYPANWRPSTSDRVLPLYSMAKRVSSFDQRDLYNDIGTVTIVGNELVPTPPSLPMGYSQWIESGSPIEPALLGWVLDPDQVIPLPIGRCEEDDDCLSGHRCLRNDYLPEETGTCVPRCDTRDDCNEEYPYCNIEYNICSKQLLANGTVPIAVGLGSLNLEHGITGRATGASYMDGKHRIRWAPPNVTRFEDRGDGYGPQWLVESYAENLVTQSTQLWDSNWDPAELCIYESSDTPGTHPSSLLQVVGPNVTCQGVSGTTATEQRAIQANMDLAPFSTPTILWPRPLTLSVWSKAASAGISQLSDDGFGAASVHYYTPATTEWTRVAHTSPSALDFNDVTQVMVGNGELSEEGTGRLVNHVQLEGTTYPTSVIEPTDLGVTAFRSDEFAGFVGVPEPSDPDTGAWGAVSYIWPYFSCADLLASRQDEQSVVVFKGMTIDPMTGQLDPSSLHELVLQVDNGICEAVVTIETSTLELQVDWERHQMLALELRDLGTDTFVELKGGNLQVFDTMVGQTLARGSMQFAFNDSSGGVTPRFNGRITPFLPLPDMAIRTNREPVKILDLQITWARGSGQQVTATITFNTNDFEPVSIDTGSTPYCGRGSRHTCVVSDINIGEFRGFVLERQNGEDPPIPIYTGALDAAFDCQNGVVEGIEECDDGNNVGNDHCSSDCLIDYPEP